MAVVAADHVERHAPQIEHGIDGRIAGDAIVPRRTHIHDFGRTSRQIGGKIEQVRPVIDDTAPVPADDRVQFAPHAVRDLIAQRGHFRVPPPRSKFTASARPAAS